MNRKLVWLSSLFILVLIISGCNSDKKVENEMTLIMDTIVETENDQYYYQLVEMLLANEKDPDLIKSSAKETEEINKKLNDLTIKTNEGKEMINYYKQEFNKREKVISTVKEEDFNEKVKDNFKKDIIEAEENETIAMEIIIDELNLKEAGTKLR